MRLSSILLSLASVVSLASAQEKPDYYYEGMIYGGSGCNQGSLPDFGPTPDKSDFTFNMIRMYAETAANIPITQSRKNCQININLVYPPGWTYRLKKFTRKGYVYLSHAGINAQARTTIYISGFVEQSAETLAFTGPVDKEWTWESEFKEEIWAPCGQVQALNINQAVLVTSISSAPKESRGYLENDPLPYRDGLNLEFEWKKC